MERKGNRKIMLPRENIHCYCFFAQLISFFCGQRSTEFFDFTSEKRPEKSLMFQTGCTYDCSAMFPMMTWENSAKVRMLRIRSRIYDLSITSSDMFRCSSTE